MTPNPKVQAELLLIPDSLSGGLPVCIPLSLDEEVVLGRGSSSIGVTYKVSLRDGNGQELIR